MTVSDWCTLIGPDLSVVRPRMVHSVSDGFYELFCFLHLSFMLKLFLRLDIGFGLAFILPARASQLIKTFRFEISIQSNLTLKAISALAAITSSE